MLRNILFCLALLASSSAWAQDYDKCVELLGNHKVCDDAMAAKVKPGSDAYNKAMEHTTIQQQHPEWLKGEDEQQQQPQPD